MEQFLSKLYSYENFSLYLIIAIFILVVLFFVILFFGKKDKKEREIEATKKLEQINSEENAFKEENNEVSVEVASPPITEDAKVEEVAPVEDIQPVEEKTPESVLENDTIVVPALDDIPQMNTEEIASDIPEVEINEPVYEEVKEDNKFIPEVELAKEEVVVEEPILSKVEEKPLVFDEVKEENVSVPEFSFDKIDNTEEVKEEIPKPTEVFSSVYVPEKEISVSDDDLDIELPTLKKETPKVEDKTEIDIPVLKDYNLDSISGESYDINK